MIRYEEADKTFSSLLDWHLGNGTRPPSDRKKGGIAWKNGEFAHALKAGLTPKAVLFWRTGRHRPRSLEYIERALFGDDVSGQHVAQRDDLRAAYNGVVLPPSPSAPDNEGATSLKDGPGNEPHGVTILRGLVERGRVAYLIPEIQTWSIDQTRLITLNISVLNAGGVAAIQPSLGLYADDIEEYRWFGTLLPGERATMTMAGRLSEGEFETHNPVLLIRASSATPDGHLICDDTNVELAWETVGEQTEVIRCDYSCKRYIHSAAITLKEGEFDE